MQNEEEEEEEEKDAIVQVKKMQSFSAGHFHFLSIDYYVITLIDRDSLLERETRSQNTHYIPI